MKDVVDFSSPCHSKTLCSSRYPQMSSLISFSKKNSPLFSWYFPQFCRGSFGHDAFLNPTHKIWKFNDWPKPFGMAGHSTFSQVAIDVTYTSIWCHIDVKYITMTSKWHQNDAFLSSCATWVDIQNQIIYWNQEKSPIISIFVESLP